MKYPWVMDITEMESFLIANSVSGVGLGPVRHLLAFGGWNDLCTRRRRSKRNKINIVSKCRMKKENPYLSLRSDIAGARMQCSTSNRPRAQTQRKQNEHRWDGRDLIECARVAVTSIGAAPNNLLLVQHLYVEQNASGRKWRQAEEGFI